LREEKLYNTAPVFDSGKLLGWQDKISLFMKERTAYSPGSTIKVFDTSAGKMVVPVCYDIDFPYFLKSSVRDGAEYAINPSLIDSEYHDMWKVYISARSLENRIPVVSVNSLSAPFSGNSIVVQPYLYTYGFKIRTIEGGSNEVFTTELDISDLRKHIRMRSEEDPGLYSLSKDESVNNTG
jgi:predicted amidohydrolase